MAADPAATRAVATSRSWWWRRARRPSRARWRRSRARRTSSATRASVGSVSGWSARSGSAPAAASERRAPSARDHAVTGVRYEASRIGTGRVQPPVLRRTTRRMSSSARSPESPHRPHGPGPSCLGSHGSPYGGRFPAPAGRAPTGPARSAVSPRPTSRRQVGRAPARRYEVARYLEARGGAQPWAARRWRLEPGGCAGAPGPLLSSERCNNERAMAPSPQGSG